MAWEVSLHEEVVAWFDPDREAILLVAGDKTGAWNQWYDENIPVADARFDEHLRALKEGEK
ncbi:hypothetical protein [Kitasatospora purpeofusca]|uniref:hypothetical protein n=1 Tax=Kitasatospora purpeofusca TaxID=67352 RepID=UPI0035D5B2B4